MPETQNEKLQNDAMEAQRLLLELESDVAKNHESEASVLAAESNLEEGVTLLKEGVENLDAELKKAEASASHEAGKDDN